MKTVKLMVVNANEPHRQKFIGQVFEATEYPKGYREQYGINGRDGFPNYSVNPIWSDEDLTIRVGMDDDGILYHLRKVSKASPRKLLVRAFKLYARHNGFNDADVKRVGHYSSVGEWARAWADMYFDKDGNFVSVYLDWRHNTERDPCDGDEWYEFADAEISSL